MWLIVVSLAAGIVLGMCHVVPVAFFRHLDKFITITLFVMLLSLGAQIGSNAELVANLPALGWRAAVIAALSIAGSVGALWLLAARLGWSSGERKEV